MTSNWISKSRNGISIPKLPQNNYLNLSYVFLWEKLNPWHFFPGFDLCDMSLGDLNGSRTSSQISKSRKRIRIPINLQNDYISMSKMFPEGIIGKLVQKTTKLQEWKIKIKKTVHLSKKWHLIQLLATLHEFKLAAIPLVTLRRFILLPSGLSKEKYENSLVTYLWIKIKEFFLKNKIFFPEYSLKDTCWVLRRVKILNHLKTEG